MFRELMLCDECFRFRDRIVCSHSERQISNDRDERLYDTILRLTPFVYGQRQRIRIVTDVNFEYGIVALTVVRILFILRYTTALSRHNVGPNLRSVRKGM